MSETLYNSESETDNDETQNENYDYELQQSFEDFKLSLNNENIYSRNNDNIDNNYNFVNNFDNLNSIDNLDKNLKKIEKEYYVYINSKSRLLDDENSTFNFAISFNDLSNGKSGINISTPLKNILKIELCEVVIPNFYLNLKEASFFYNKNFITSKITSQNMDSLNLRVSRLSDLQYIGVTIENIENISVIGSDNDINKASFIMTVDNIIDLPNHNTGYYEVNSNNNYVEVGNINNSLLANTDKNRIVYKNNYGSNVIYGENDVSLLPNIRLIIKDVNGNTLNYLNDTLTIKNVVYDINLSNQLLITFNTCFSTDEYKLGDIIVINNISIVSVLPQNVDWRKDNFISFLKRPEGHTIIQHDISNIISNTRLFNGLYISVPFDYINTATTANTIFNNKNFGLTNNLTVNLNVDNKVVNINNQIVCTFKITCKQYDKL